jgi:redox-regulated HSP33 family molecular chaperone
MFGGKDRDTTKLQDCILQQYDMGVSNPNQIAANCDCSESHVKGTLDEYRPNWNEGNGFSLF